MRRPTLLILLAAIALATSIAYATGSQPATADAYRGSESCKSCHEAEYASWRRNLHVQMTKPVAEARVVGDFGPGAALSENGRSYRMEQRDGRYFVTVVKGTRPAESFEVSYTLGARRFQGYLSRLPDGRIYVLPVFWHVESRRWIDYEQITPIPRDSEHDFRQIWNVTCVNCHATNLVRHFTPATNTFATTWTEMGIGCEACHGPGQAHIDDPAHLKIFSMKKVAPRQVFDACGYCHGNKNNLFFGFKPGDHYDDYALPFLISQPIPDNDPQGDFWPDGRPSRFNRPQALTVTGCFQRGEATCTSCHRMHGSDNSHSLKVAIDSPGGGHSRASDSLCTQCHGDRLAANLQAHTHHAADSQGSRCINCHMSDVNWRLFTRRLDHTFQPPNPELTARFGVPNACTSCHEDRSPEWAATTMDTWYGNHDRRQATVKLADTMYRAGTGDTTVLRDLVSLAVDRGRGALIRASAAEFAGQLIAKGAGGAAVPAATVNGLIGAANDTEPWVRITAVRALGQMRDESRVTSVIAAHLVDPSRVVRVIAAEALMARGVVQMEGPAGDALRRAQDEWAESLRTFDDDGNDQTTLGWLEESRGRRDGAVAALASAVALSPNDPRPRAYLGIIAARSGKYDEALQYFRAVKTIDASYPNIDRLIEEAQKRR